MTNSRPSQLRRLYYLAAGLFACAAVGFLIAGDLSLMTSFVALFVVFVAALGQSGPVDDE